MEQRRLGRTDLQVSSLCLGTMTYGEQNSEADAHAQLDYALANGVNFIDTAEMYPVPPKAKTQGLTEQYIGSWIKARANRDKFILASKVAGPSFDYIRNGDLRLDRKNIVAALDASLKRLNTDYIDLYQLHWPERRTNYFGQLNYAHDESEPHWTELTETLQVLDEQIKAGKIRHVGLSNETPWGTMKYLALAEQYNLPRMATIQNPYSLLNRSFEVGLAEISHREDIGLLAYSPLGFGVLSGKYLGETWPADGRLTLFERFQRYTNEAGTSATRAYVELAQDHKLDPAQMALAFVTGRSFVSSNIIGATTMDQLRSNIASASLVLSADVMEEFENIHKKYTIPCP